MCKNVHYEWMLEPLLAILFSRKIYTQCIGQWTENIRLRKFEMLSIILILYAFYKNVDGRRIFIFLYFIFLSLTHFWLKGHPYNCEFKRKSNRVNNTYVYTHYGKRDNYFDKIYLEVNTFKNLLLLLFTWWKTKI